jgi:hypothetical protein
MRAWSLDLIGRAKWALWHGQVWKREPFLTVRVYVLEAAPSKKRSPGPTPELGGHRKARQSHPERTTTFYAPGETGRFRPSTFNAPLTVGLGTGKTCRTTPKKLATSGLARRASHARLSGKSAAGWLSF